MLNSQHFLGSGGKSGVRGSTCYAERDREANKWSQATGFGGLGSYSGTHRREMQAERWGIVAFTSQPAAGQCCLSISLISSLLSLLMFQTWCLYLISDKGPINNGYRYPYLFFKCCTFQLLLSRAHWSLGKRNITILMHKAQICM